CFSLLMPECPIVSTLFSYTTLFRSSGDLLASRVITGLKQRQPDAVCEGIGGPAMQQAGFDAWHPMHALTVFGYVDAFKRLPGLLDRKSTRLNSSHVKISYAVFCLKK